MRLAHANPELRAHIVPLLKDAAADRTIKKDLRLKSGDVIPRGTKVTVVFLGEHHPDGARLCQLVMNFNGPSGRDYFRDAMKTSISRLPDQVSGFKAPSVKTMEKWSNDAIALTPTGKRVEPDGYGPDGSPSWMLVLGII